MDEAAAPDGAKDGSPGRKSWETVANAPICFLLSPGWGERMHARPAEDFLSPHPGLKEKERRSAVAGVPRTHVLGYHLVPRPGLRQGSLQPTCLHLLAGLWGGLYNPGGRWGARERDIPLRTCARQVGRPAARVVVWWGMIAGGPR